MNNRWIIVFDWETDSPNPDTCNPVELAAVPVDPRTLEIKTVQPFVQTILIQKSILQKKDRALLLGTQSREE